MTIYEVQVGKDHTRIALAGSGMSWGFANDNPPTPTMPMTLWQRQAARLIARDIQQGGAVDPTPLPCSTPRASITLELSPEAVEGVQQMGSQVNDLIETVLKRMAGQILNGMAPLSSMNTTAMQNAVQRDLEARVYPTPLTDDEYHALLDSIDPDDYDDEDVDYDDLENDDVFDDDDELSEDELAAFGSDDD